MPQVYMKREMRYY